MEGNYCDYCKNCIVKRIFWFCLSTTVYTGRLAALFPREKAQKDESVDIYLRSE